MILPGAEPFMHRGGPTGCLLIHGFTASPQEMRGLGEHLASPGHTAVGIRSADKHLQLIERSTHVITCDAAREQVFESAARFVRRQSERPA